MRFPRSAALALSIALLSSAPVALAAGGAAAASGSQVSAGRSCQTVTIPVALAQGAAASEHLSAEYCTPAGPRVTRIVDVLVGGATYNSILYWDWPQDPDLYSYVDKTLAAGRATLAIDRLGTGSSSKPPSAEITDAVSAYTVHQAISWIRARGYAQVDLIGHSLGSAIAEEDAATWPGDVNRLVLTGLLNETGSNIPVAEQDLVPVSADAALAGYVTTKAGTRGQLFYGPRADPAVIAYDEAHKDQVSLTELATGLAMVATPAASNPASRIKAPVLIVVGQDDFLYCEGSGVIACTDLAALRAYEAPYFASAPSLTIATIPGTGHDLALSPSAPFSFRLIDAWINNS